MLWCTSVSNRFGIITWSCPGSCTGQWCVADEKALLVSFAALCRRKLPTRSEHFYWANVWHWDPWGGDSEIAIALTLWGNCWKEILFHDSLTSERPISLKYTYSALTRFDLFLGLNIIVVVVRVLNRCLWRIYCQCGISVSRDSKPQQSAHT